MDPLASIVAPVVPERRRFCSDCDTALKRDAGFCPKCGQEYSFVPTLKEGDSVAGKYEVKGTVAFGGLGWIYLALDTVLNRWVILKGLLNSKDPHMLAVAVQEREYLAAVKHPNIVGIYDFVTHGAEGFIVMESVNGKTLMQLRKEAGGPLPVAEAISYIVEILPAFGYLDDQGLVYCDFKPDNCMVEEETVKLIDLGAVRRVDDTAGDIYGSKGYSAPEATSNPTPVSDLYTVGRALAVMVASFDFQGKYEHSLPPPSECDVWTKHDALYRFLLKATRVKEDERFQTAAEMAEQLVGVLRSIVGETDELGHIESAMFDPDSDPSIEAARAGEAGAMRGTDGIPRLKVDREDQAAALIVAAGAVSDPEKRIAMFARGLAGSPASVELRLRWIDELIALGQFDEAERRLAEVQATHPTDWRLGWYRGRASLAQGRIKETLAAFETIVNELPGELGPKQALGRAHEAGGAIDRAIEYYDAVSRADGTFVSAALGLARCLQKKNDLAGAAAAYRRVPSTSSRYAFAQSALARVLLEASAKGPHGTAGDEVLQAAAAVEALDGLVSGLDAHKLRADVLVAAVRVAKNGQQPRTGDVLGVPFEERPLRVKAEEELRACGRSAPTDQEKFAFVDEANRVRPVTLF
jgi:serine/threonine-protein kinase PknG